MRKPETVKADLASRRAAAEKRARGQIDILKAGVFLRRCKDTAEALERLQMRTPLGFTTLADLLAPQPWALDNGVLIGHLLTMEEVVYQEAISADAFDAASLDAAMRMAWADAAEYQEWASIYVEVLRSLADHAEQTALTNCEGEEIEIGVPVAGGASERRGSL